MQLLDCVLRRGLLAEEEGGEADAAESAKAQTQPQQIPAKELSAAAATTATTATTKKKKPPVPPPKNKHKINRRSASTQTHMRDFLVIMTKKTATKKPPIPPKNERHRAFQPTRKPTKRRSNTIRSVQSPPPVLTPTKVHRPQAAVAIDADRGPTRDRFWEDLTLPGDLDWHDLPVSSAITAAKLSPLLFGPESQGRKASTTLTAPLPILMQPTWDHSAVIDLPELD
ncbi:hypothetical protein F5Y14DRAFT_429870 [Nemania sp. NC0429]|nr:hypothetical protein F5Y14DRAFT_429870 [Nemania sp. NC0429]